MSLPLLAVMAALAAGAPGVQQGPVRPGADIAATRTRVTTPVPAPVPTPVSTPVSTPVPASGAAAGRPGRLLAPMPRGGWQWPIRPRPRLLRRFEIGPARWSPGHRGVDLSATAGAAIRAPAAGIVSFAGPVAGRPVLSIDQGGGLISSLEPVIATVHRGDAVSAGQVIGTMSPLPGHCAPAACLHWGVRSAGQYIDPLLLVDGAYGPIVLLPDG